MCVRLDDRHRFGRLSYWASSKVWDAASRPNSPITAVIRIGKLAPGSVCRPGYKGVPV
jgi:hypothetical protein